MTLCLLTISILYTTHLSAQFENFFSHTIKGEKSEYNVLTGAHSNVITISNVSNTWGTAKFPDSRLEDHGGGMYTKNDYINIYKIIRNSMDPKDFTKLLDTEKFQTQNLKNIDKNTLQRLRNSDQLVICVVYYPNTGKVFEVFFSLVGKKLMKISPDYYSEIEKEIKKNIILHKIIGINGKNYIQCRYEYHFNDLDSREINGEKVILSNIK